MGFRGGIFWVLARTGGGLTTEEGGGGGGLNLGQSGISSLSMLETEPLRLETEPLSLETGPLRLETEPLRLETEPLKLDVSDGGLGGAIGGGLREAKSNSSL